MKRKSIAELKQEIRKFVEKPTKQQKNVLAEALRAKGRKELRKDN